MYCLSGEVLPLPVMSAEDAMLPVSKSITAELREQWAVLNEVWGTPMAQWKGVAVAAWMEAAIGKSIILRTKTNTVQEQASLLV